MRTYANTQPEKLSPAVRLPGLSLRRLLLDLFFLFPLLSSFTSSVHECNATQTVASRRS